LPYGSGMDSAADAVPRGYRIGYGRVCTRDQNPDSQREALKPGRTSRDQAVRQTSTKPSPNDPRFRQTEPDVPRSYSPSELR